MFLHSCVSPPRAPVFFLCLNTFKHLLRWLCSVVTFVFATIPEPASKLSIYGRREVHESGTQNEVAKALKGREKEGLVTIPSKFSFCFT